MLILKVLKTSFKRFYHDSFRLVLINLLWSFIMGFLGVFSYAAYSAGLLFLLIIPLVLCGPLLLAGFKVADCSFQEQSIRVRDLFKYFKKYFQRGFKAFIFSAIVYGIFLMDFYIFAEMLESNHSLLDMLFIIILFLFFVFCIMQLYFWPLLIIYDKKGIYELLKQAFALCFSRVFFSVIWLAIFVFIFGFLVYIRFGVPPFFITLPALYLISGVRLLLGKS